MILWLTRSFIFIPARYESQCTKALDLRFHLPFMPWSQTCMSCLPTFIMRISNRHDISEFLQFPAMRINPPIRPNCTQPSLPFRSFSNHDHGRHPCPISSPGKISYHISPQHGHHVTDPPHVTPKPDSSHKGFVSCCGEAINWRDGSQQRVYIIPQVVLH
jgi:hypothetical protein